MTDFDPFSDEAIDTDFEEDLDLDMDMTGVKRADFTPAPEDDYRLKVEDAKLQKNTTSGNISIATVFSILYNLEYQDPEMEGKKIFHYTWVKGPKFEEKNKKFVKSYLDAVTGEDNSSGVSLNREFLDNLVGNECDAHVKIQSKQGYADKNVIARFLFDEDED